MNHLYLLAFLAFAFNSMAQHAPLTSGVAIHPNGGRVTTIAERDIIELSIDGPGAMARFASPAGIAVAADGTLYVTDRYIHTIRRILPTGWVTTLAGQVGQPGAVDGPGPSARFSHPMGIAIDGNGYLYVADRYNHTIRKISPAGIVSTLAGLAGIAGDADGIGDAARFNEPVGVAVDATGTVYVADCFNHSVRRITPKGEVTTFARSVPKTVEETKKAVRYASDEATTPAAVALSANGKLYVGCRDRYAGDSTLRQVAAVHGQTSALPLFHGLGLVVDTHNNIIVASEEGIEIISLQREGNGKAIGPYLEWYLPSSDLSWTQRESSDRQRLPQSPTSVALDKAGYTYFTDEENQSVNRISPSGTTVEVIAGRGCHFFYDGKPLLLRGRLAVTATGMMYAADPMKQVIYRISPTGSVSIFAGVLNQQGNTDGTGNAVRFRQPQAVAVDATGTVYVADAGNHTIRRISPDGVVTTLAGQRGQPGSTDGAAALARFNYPTGVAVDAAGTVYVADQNNHLIRQVSTAGVVSTLAGKAGVAGIADGMGPQARFNSPQDVAVDSTGAVYVADGGHTIRIIR